MRMNGVGLAHVEGTTAFTRILIITYKFISFNRRISLPSSISGTRLAYEFARHVLSYATDITGNCFGPVDKFSPT